MKTILDLENTFSGALDAVSDENLSAVHGALAELASVFDNGDLFDLFYGLAISVEHEAEKRGHEL